MTIPNLMDDLIKSIQAWKDLCQKNLYSRRQEISLTHRSAFGRHENIDPFYFYTSFKISDDLSGHDRFKAIEVENGLHQNLLALLEAIQAIPHFTDIEVKIEIDAAGKNPKFRILFDTVAFMDAPRTGHIGKNVAKRLAILERKSKSLIEKCGTPTGYWKFGKEQGKVRANSAGEALAILNYIKTGGIGNRSLYNPEPSLMIEQTKAEAEMNTLLDTSP